MARRDFYATWTSTHPQARSLAVVGQNGAGKSTLLKLLSGELSPTAGEVLVGGRLLSDYAPQDLALRRAVLPQQTILQFAFKARDVVLMGRSPHLRGTWASLEDEEIAERSMYLTETDRFASRVYTSLSGGEQARVNLARVLTQEAPILLLDEPTTSLDMRHQELIMRTARNLAGEGACVLAVLHDLNLAAAYSDRIAVLQDGAPAHGRHAGRGARFRVALRGLRLPAGGRPAPGWPPLRRAAALAGLY